MDKGISYVEIIRDQTNRALWSVGNVIDCIPDDMWEELYCEMPLWKHVYHMLLSLDTWYINPRKYQAPPFHVKDLNNLDVTSEKNLSKELLNEFFLSVEKKIKDYDKRLSDDLLLEKPENCEWSRFTLIMAQHRHLHSHMGMLMGFIIARTGLWPRVIGLEGVIPENGYTKYY